VHKCACYKLFLKIKLMFFETNKEDTHLCFDELLLCAMYVENGLDLSVQPPPLPLTYGKVLLHVALDASHCQMLYLHTQTHFNEELN
jgi:hypothetical protein